MAAGVSLGVIGGSVGSGSLVLLGLHIYGKKKKERENEANEKEVADNSDSKCSK